MLIILCMFNPFLKHSLCLMSSAASLYWFHMHSFPLENLYGFSSCSAEPSTKEERHGRCSPSAHFLTSDSDVTTSMMYCDRYYCFMDPEKARIGPLVAAETNSWFDFLAKFLKRSKMDIVWIKIETWYFYSISTFPPPKPVEDYFLFSFAEYETTWVSIQGAPSELSVWYWL